MRNFICYMPVFSWLTPAFTFTTASVMCHAKNHYANSFFWCAYELQKHFVLQLTYFNSTVDIICASGFLLDITYFNYSAFLVHGHYSAFLLLDISSSQSHCRLSVCPSVTLMDQDHIGWKSWKLIGRTISPTSSLFVDQRSSTYTQGNMEKFGGD